MFLANKTIKVSTVSDNLKFL